MNITICDDSLSDANILKNHIQQYLSEHSASHAIIRVVTTAKDLFSVPQPDILFLDIELGNESGIALAKQVNELYPDTIIVFVSAHSCYVTESYHVRATQFLTKPLQPMLFSSVMHQVLTLYYSQYAVVKRMIQNELVSIPKKDVVCLEAKGKTVILTLSSGDSLEYPGSLATESIDFHEPDFVRAHRGFIVSLRHVKQITYSNIILQLKYKNALSVPVGRTLYRQIYAAYLKYHSL